MALIMQKKLKEKLGYAVRYIVRFDEEVDGEALKRASPTQACQGSVLRFGAAGNTVIRK